MNSHGFGSRGFGTNGKGYGSHGGDSHEESHIEELITVGDGEHEDNNEVDDEVEA